MRKMEFRIAALACCCGFVIVSAALADPITVANTGSSGGVALSVGTVDPNYTLVSAPAGVTTGNAYATSPNGLWTNNTSTADWISPGSSGNTSWPVGTYKYQTTFSLTGYNPSTAELSGMWTSDNDACIYLNGANTGDCTAFANFGTLEAFSITSGFISGLNTLDFVVDNGGGSPSPTGVIAEVSGTASSGTPVVPEPSSLLLSGGGGLGLALLYSRRLGGWYLRKKT